MRLRLLIDVLWDEERIPGLQGLVAEQAPVIIKIPMAFGEVGGRLMGAVPVEAVEEAEAH